MKIIQIVGVAGGVALRSPDAREGDYVKSFDPDAHDGRGALVTTPNVAEALGFPSMEEAWAFWKQDSTVRPLRPDGRPNRPLTAFTVTFLNRDDEELRSR